MNVTMLAGPLIGAGIGYCTNYIAVKMLFRPLRPVTIGSFTLPFTPGIIPKGRERLARAVAAAVGQSLLTEHMLKDKLLSEDMKDFLLSQYDSWIADQSENQTTLQDLALCHVSQEQLSHIKEQTVGWLTLEIWKQLCQAGLGETVSQAVLKAVKEKVHGSLLGLMVTDSMVDGFGEPISKEVEQMIEQQGQDKLRPMVEKQWETMSDIPVCVPVTAVLDSEVAVRDMIWDCYSQLVETQLSGLWQQIDIMSLIEAQISGMDVLEVEKLVLSVMKKELDAVVNLGAFIGFVLGTLNLFFG